MIASKFATDPGGPDQCRRKRGCGEVAHRRAARYAIKHRIPKTLWPLIAAVILVWLIFDRRPLAVVSWTWGRPATNGGALRSAPMPDPDDGQDIDRFPSSGDTGSAFDDVPEPQYQPPSDFLVKDVVQVVAFLLRNRGRLDNVAVRAKWDLLDRLSLPLAIYLRDVEAKAAWNDLEQEISVAPYGTPGVSGRDLPKSLRHGKLLRLLPEWSRRGEELLSPRPANRSSGAWTLERENDDDADRKPPKP